MGACHIASRSFELPRETRLCNRQHTMHTDVQIEPARDVPRSHSRVWQRPGGGSSTWVMPHIRMTSCWRAAGPRQPWNENPRVTGGPFEINSITCRTILTRSVLLLHGVSTLTCVPWQEFRRTPAFPPLQHA